jgi:hypothetical protein
MKMVTVDYRGLGLGALSYLIEEPYHEYYFHLGRFIHAFAKAEDILLELLRMVSGLSKARAGVVFHGTRAEGARDLIFRLLEARKDTALKKRLEPIFAQMATIGTMRNNIVHWGSTHSIDNTFFVSNEKLKPLKPKSFYFDINDFDRMGSDISKIILLLQYEININAISKEDYETFVQYPWRYKPPQPYRKPKARNLDQAKPQRLRRASARSQG